MREEQFRRKVTWFSFGFSLLVVWVHSYNAELYLGKTAEMERIYRLESLLGDGVGQIAVPGFFMISAYLFYRNFSWGKLQQKWISRVRSVLVPFILWNFIYYLGYVIGSRLPWMTDVVGKGTIPFTLDAAVDAVINYRYNYVFWYLYQLMLLILLAPALYGVLRRVWTGALFQLAVWGLLAAGIGLGPLNGDALAYYSFSAYLALHGKNLAEAGWSWKRGMFGGVCLALSFGVFWFGLWQASTVCFALSRLLAVMGLWTAVPERWLGPPGWFMTCNFFLYATHFAWVRFLNKAGAELLRAAGAIPTEPWVPAVLFFVMPGLVLGICAGIGQGMKRWMPRIWILLNGGR